MLTAVSLHLLISLQITFADSNRSILRQQIDEQRVLIVEQKKLLQMQQQRIDQQNSALETINSPLEQMEAIGNEGIQTVIPEGTSLDSQNVIANNTEESGKILSAMKSVT